MTCKASDQAPFVEPRRTVQAAYGCLSAIQDEPPGVQLMAATVLFKAITEELNLDVSQLLNSASRIINADDTPYRTEVVALRGYVKGELK